MFDIFLGDGFIFVGGLAVYDVVGVAVEDLAAEIIVAEVREAALGECLVMRVDVTAGAHAVHKPDAGSEDRGAAEKIVLLTDCIADSLHSKTKALDTGDRWIMGLDACDVLVLFEHVVLESITHEVHFEVSNTPVLFHHADAFGNVGSRARV